MLSVAKHHTILLITERTPSQDALVNVLRLRWQRAERH